MLLKIIFPFCIILFISSCSSAKKYEFPWHLNPKPQSDFVEGSTQKLLTHGDPCDYKWNVVGAQDPAKGFCRASAGIRCQDKKCVCFESGTEWDPKVEYISSDYMDKDQRVKGKCALTKGMECMEKERKPNSGEQCKSDLTCVLDPNRVSDRLDSYVYNFNKNYKEKEIYGLCQ